MGTKNWQEVTNRKHTRTNDDDVFKISKSVYVTNFPESTSARDLWKTCSMYGMVVDVFVPSKTSKASKRFSFVRFINVFNLDRLVENLSTIWIGSFHLFANKVCFERPHKPNETPNANSWASSRIPKPSIPQHSNSRVGSYVNIVNGVSLGMQGSAISTLPALVLDDTCLVDRDLSNHAMGKVKDFSSIPNLYTILNDKGFSDVKLSYLRGLWVLFKFNKMATKVIIKGKVFMVRAKELFTRNPTFLVHKEKVYTSEDQSIHESVNNEFYPHPNKEEPRNNYASDEDGVPETVFGSSSSSHKQDNRDKDVTHSEDPFKLYDLLKNKKGLGHKTKKEWIKALANSFKLNVLAIQETKMTRVSDMDVKFLLGNSNYDYVCSDSLGSSGGILCIWEALVFKKDNVTVSDNFIAIYGTWLPSNFKILFVAIYAPQRVLCKKNLLDYISIILGRWNGETIIMGDFNKVRSSDERYTFAWAHPLASKMSKLDRFLVSDGSKNEMIFELGEIDKVMDRGEFDDATIFHRFELKRKLLNVTEMEAKERFQKSKVKWGVKGDENSKFFHGIINNRRSQLAIRGIFVDEKGVSCDEIWRAIWSCGDNKSSGPDGYTFEFLKKYWDLIGSDFCDAVIDAKFVNDFRPISLIVSVYKVVTKVVSNRLAPVIVDLISDTQIAFIAGRQILDGLFILDEILHWCKRKKKQAMFFKGDFVKAYDSVREWSYENLKGIITILKSFFLASGVQINIIKSQLLGVGVPRHEAWDDVILKLRSHLSKWKVKTLSIGGRLTLLKFVLGASPIYYMSIFKVPLRVLKVMESIRSRFFNGMDQSDKKVTSAAWNKVIRAIYGPSVGTHSTHLSFNWCSIVREVHKLKGKGFDFCSHCKKRIGNGNDTQFWFDCWIGDIPLRDKFRRLFALELDKEASVAVKLNAPIEISFCRNARGGLKQHLMADMNSMLDSVVLMNFGDCWVCDLASDGNFLVKEHVLRRICRWWGLDPPGWTSFQEWQADGENLDKMKEKGVECIFVGYSSQSRAYRVFNKRTRVIMESIHVNFDELPQMASDHSSSDPVPECQTVALNHDSLSPANELQANVPPADRTVTTSNELDLLFSLMFDELLNGSSKVVSKSFAVSAADAPYQPETYAENDQVADDEFINIFSTPVQDQGETSSRHVDSSNMHTFYQRYPSEHRWTKDHPLEQVIGNPSQSVRTGRQLELDAEMCMFALT
nr:RNA-directed DNA polymerase, eukaryota [Tanacetum cinerariifolium]